MIADIHILQLLSDNDYEQPFSLIYMVGCEIDIT